ncbi:MAG: hypothetical protein SGI96_19665 [Bacteroidota bacterium]|nr:hypothetical protein [Bacteroidota bacterium]
MLKAIVAGMKYFITSLFITGGQQVFTTSDNNKVWDGKIGGLEKGFANFIWMAEGVDYKGNFIRRKGNTTVIR